MANIPIRDIFDNITPSANDYIVIDNGKMGKAHLSELADSIRPVASQVEAEAGADNAKTMTSLRVKESIESEIGISVASKSQGDAADSALQPLDIGASVQGFDADLTAIAALTPVDNDILQRKSGAWTNRTVAQVKSDLSLSTVATSGDYSDLINKPSLGTAAAADASSFATAAQGMKADSAVQPSRKVDAGTGLSGGGDFSADRVISLDSASQASLTKADSAVQPADLGLLAAKDKVGISDIDATGVPSSSTFLRGDGVWGAGGGGGGGDLLAANNLSDLADADAALTNLGVTATGKTLAKAPNKAAAQSALDIGLVLIASATASNSASVSFDLPSGYAEFLIAVSGAQPATSSSLNLVFGTSGASGSMLTGATDYAYTGFGSAETPGTMFTSNSTGASEIAMTGSTSSGGWVDTWIRINGARDAARMLTAIVDSFYRGTGSGSPFSKLSISGRRTGYSAENACRLSFSSGNIAIGSFKLYGRP